MKKGIIFDCAGVLVTPVDTSYKGSISELHQSLVDLHGQEYSFFKFFNLNEELIQYIRTLRWRADVYMFTNDTILDNREIASILKPLFKDIYIAREFGTDQEVPDNYRVIADNIEDDVRNLVYIDDTKSHVLAAQGAGLTAFLHENNTRTIQRIRGLF